MHKLFTLLPLLGLVLLCACGRSASDFVQNQHPLLADKPQEETPNPGGDRRDFTGGDAY